jgi:outer membrane protein OmpA-like peptidoglycan-associated protein
MKSLHLAPTLLTVALLAAACSSTPTTTSLLDQARSDFQVAQSSPSVITYAPLELKQAGAALDLANTAATKNESSSSIDKLAYLAKQKIALAQEITKQKTAEAEVGRAAKERDQMRLDQRTAEANKSKLDAQQSQVTAQIAQNEAENAKRKALAAQDETANAQRVAQEAQARSAQLEAQLRDLSAKKTERGIIITLGDVLFGTDLSRLNSDGMRTAQKLAAVLQENPQRTVLVEGFTDSTGAAAYNQQLSERRANAVRSALLEQGVAPSRIAIKGYGEDYPVTANETAANRHLNRRVEIVLSDDNGKIVAR